jgi:DNA ligase-1
MRVSLADYAAEWKWDGIRVQIVRPAARPASTAAPATTSPQLPRSRASFDREGVVDGELLVKGAFQGAEEHGGRAPAASTRSSSGSAARPSRSDAERLSGLRPALRHPLDGKEDVAALPWSDRRARLEALSPRSTPSASTSLR